MAILRATAQHLLSGLHHRAAVRLRERGTPPPEALLKSCSRGTNRVGCPHIKAPNVLLFHLHHVFPLCAGDLRLIQ